MGQQAPLNVSLDLLYDIESGDLLAIYDLARKRNIGRELPLELFQQDVLS